jgi:hypothetical protein
MTAKPSPRTLAFQWGRTKRKLKRPGLRSANFPERRIGPISESPTIRSKAATFWREDFQRRRLSGPSDRAWAWLLSSRLHEKILCLPAQRAHERERPRHALDGILRKWLKMEPERNVDSEGRQLEEQSWYCVQFDEDSPPVMMAIEAPSVLDNEAQKEALIDSAWDFHCRGVWARENSNPQFIRNLAGDFQKSIPVPNIIARGVVSQLLNIYVKRLEREVEEKGEAVVDENAPHLVIERSGPDEINVVVDLPEGWDSRAVEQLTKDVGALMATPDEHLLSWYGFSKWMWTTQLAHALGDLENELGTDALERLPADQFHKALFDRMLRSDDSGLEVGALIQSYSDMIAGIIIEAVANESHELWMLERFLALRLHPPKSPHPGKSGIIAIDFARLLEVIGRQPREAYELPPRRFEELIGHIFERFGYDVELTAESRDGGYDISAVRRAETDVRLLIECKRYTPPNKVGRPILQRLGGVLNDRDIQATKGILATTSTFTSDALKYLEMNRWRLEGRDLEGILDWIRRACGTA